MPTTEAQKRALKKWREKNPDKCNEYNRRWREDNEEYRIKQNGYSTKCQKRRRDFLRECRRLCEILL